MHKKDFKSISDFYKLYLTSVKLMLIFRLVCFFIDDMAIIEFSCPKAVNSNKRKAIPFRKGLECYVESRNRKQKGL